jgi:hypothetical protein
MPQPIGESSSSLSLLRNSPTEKSPGSAGFTRSKHTPDSSQARANGSMAEP